MWQLGFATLIDFWALTKIAKIEVAGKLVFWTGENEVEYNGEMFISPAEIILANTGNGIEKEVPVPLKNVLELHAQFQPRLHDNPFSLKFDRSIKPVLSPDGVSPAPAG